MNSQRYNQFSRSYLAVVSVFLLSFLGFSLYPSKLETIPPRSINLPVDKLPEVKPKPIVESSKTIRKLNLVDSQTVYLEGPIGETAKNIAFEIKQKARENKKVYLLIDSPGGSVVDGAIIVSAIESSSAEINTICMGTCASMAFVIHQYGHKRYAIDRSILMAHPASSTMEGTLEQIQTRINTISRYVDKMDAHIAKRVGMSLIEFKVMIASEFWIDAEDASHTKFLDQIVDVDVGDLPENEDTLYEEVIAPKQKVNVTWW